MEFSNYIGLSSKKKWFDVVVFYAEPHETPKTSTEGKTIARFTSLTDACEYAYKIQEDANRWAQWARGTGEQPSRLDNHHAEYHDYARVAVR
ncbi:MAG: hypothetical protein EHM35_00555 [Planctomycetaceae bacterium]|nr:MAG: hypothetical protein EHM35_00555 [Planctomycetaceae bacterium]